MAKITRNFTAAKMNKSTDDRLIPDGEYIDAMNCSIDNVNGKDGGVVTSVTGNTKLSTICYSDGTPVSSNAVCIGAINDDKNRKIYWFVHDPSFQVGIKLDMIVSINVDNLSVVYHVISKSSGVGVPTVLNFNPNYLITAVNIIDDLLLFTDNYNQPRKINVTRTYLEASLEASDLLLVKAPPRVSPSITMTTGDPDDSFMDDKFICFAYRYRYSDGEYSAISQFTQPAFIAGIFRLDSESFTNDGMLNSVVSVSLSYNSGGKNVIGIDILSKESNSNTIKLIAKINKAENGLVDDTLYNYTVSNDRFLSILPDYELLRLYDSVPILAKAQTTMGNRLMYGNYKEGYDMNDMGGFPVNIDYLVSLVSELYGQLSLASLVSPGTYTINGPVVKPDCSISIDFGGVKLSTGNNVKINIIFTHGSFDINSGAVTIIPDTTGDTAISFEYELVNDYVSVYDLSISPEFISYVDTTFTALFYNSLPALLIADKDDFTVQYTFTKGDYGISAIGDPVSIISSPGSDLIAFQFPAVYFEDIPNAMWMLEYYSVTSATASTFVLGDSSTSLRSNRSYTVGMIYMDGFNRSSTVLLSDDSSLLIPASLSSSQNKIQVTIPPTQVAPSWATRYKFAIKQTGGNYETIFSRTYLVDGDSVYFLLEGENIRKINEGDRLILKGGPSGSVQSLITLNVLEKEAKEVAAPFTVAGTYMKIAVSDFGTNTGVYGSTGIVVFETEASDSIDNIYYESSDSFAIDQSTGNHYGNLQDQNIASAIPGEVVLAFYNCYQFGNGVESFKIEDSIIGNYFNIGTRVCTQSPNEYGQVNYSSSITYSGVYNDESNLNKLNEFNSGLLNYKSLEDSFGSIQVIDGRETDILVLQEDKVSYVLAGKNLLSDAAAGGTIASIPEVLGTQIARIEEFGISNNPESYSSYGYDRHFTDARRGVVLRLRGGSYSNETLEVISDTGMRSWFKDSFNNSTDQIKLGAYDPYNNHYVLSSQDKDLPVVQKMNIVGPPSTVETDSGAGVVLSFDLGNGVGKTKVYYKVISADVDASVIARYNGVEYYSGPVIEGGDGYVEKDGSSDIIKDSIFVNELTVSVSSHGKASVLIIVDELVKQTLTVRRIILTSKSDAGKSSHFSHRFQIGSFSSSARTDKVTFIESNDLFVESYDESIVGYVGDPGFPVSGSDVIISSDKYANDTQGFNPAINKFYRGFSATNYTDISALFGYLTEIVSTTNDGVNYNGVFEMPNIVGDDKILYLVWDLRYRKQISLYSGFNDTDACCKVNPPELFYINGPSLIESTGIFTTINMESIVETVYYSDEESSVRVLSSGLLDFYRCKPCPYMECGDSIETTSDEKGLYNAICSTGNSTGAILVSFNPGVNPGGIIVEVNGKKYNYVYAYAAGTLVPTLLSSDIINSPVFIGNSASICTITGAHTIKDLLWNGSWVVDGEDIGINVVSGQIKLTPVDTGTCGVVIPKTSDGQMNLDIKIYQVCATSNEWLLDVRCPVMLSGFPAARVVSGDPCLTTSLPISLYTINLSGSSGSKAVGNIAFVDPYGSRRAVDVYGEGWYRWKDGKFRIDSSGMIVESDMCAPIGGLLSPFASSSLHGTEYSVCSLPINLTVYNITGAPAIGNTVYTDANGTSSKKLATLYGAGKYRFSTGWFDIDSNSIITAIGATCPDPLDGFSSGVKASKSLAACDTLYSRTYYTDGGFTGAGNVIYVDAYKTQRLALAYGAGYYKSPLGGWFLINSSSVVTAVGNCPILQ